jgi:predicted nucleic acid-binding protein
MTTEQSEIAITLLQSLLIQVDEATDSSALSSTLVLGRQEGLAAYDAAYLELALRLNCRSQLLIIAWQKRQLAAVWGW